jgi:hypothetical protein
MKRQPWGLYAIALAIVIVGLVALGVPASTLLVAALVLACPLMMLFMRAGMHGGHDRPDQGRQQQPGSADHDRQHPAGR